MSYSESQQPVDPMASVPEKEPKPEGIKRNQWQMLGILSAVFIPMLIAYTLFKTQVGVPQNTINKGELVPVPQQMNELNLIDLKNEPWDSSQMADKWWLVTPIAEVCDESCQQSLWVTRQVRTRLNEKRGRVKRLAVLTATNLEPSVKEKLSEEHPDLTWVSASNYSNWAQSQPLLESAPKRGYFIVDQQGWAMMTYDSRQSGNDLLKDIKRLLRYSYEAE